MKQIEFLGRRVGVEKLKRQPKQNKKDTPFFVEVETDEFVGIIQYLGPEATSSLSIGDQVYFGNQHQLVRMVGREICVMEDSNVLAKVKDDIQEASDPK